MGPDYICPESPIISGFVTACSIPPDFVKSSVLGDYFFHLLGVLNAVLVLTPILGVSIPRGNIYTSLYIKFSTSVCKFLYYIAVSILVRCVFNRMLRIF